MLLLILQIAQVVVSVCLIILVLVHSPKGDGIGGIGGAAQIFSSQRGAEAGLNKLTSWFVVAFFIVCGITGFYGSHLIQFK